MNQLYISQKNFQKTYIKILKKKIILKEISCMVQQF